MTVMWLFDSSVVAAVDGVIVVVPPVILAANAVPAITNDAIAASTIAMRIRRIGLPFISLSAKPLNTNNATELWRSANPWRERSWRAACTRGPLSA